MAQCPTCNQAVSSAFVDSEARRLLEILTNHVRHRNVYRAQNGSGWYVTQGGGPFSEKAVKKLVASRSVGSVYSDCPNDAYHVGRTYDVARTLEARKRTGNRSVDIYVEDPLALQESKP